jgi:hypothetical protein
MCEHADTGRLDYREAWTDEDPRKVTAAGWGLIERRLRVDLRRPHRAEGTRGPMAKRKRGTVAKTGARGPQPARPRCGLCHNAGRLTRTPCCGHLICDDEDQYVLFSYARNSRSRNHSRYTLCASHFNEGHPGAWRDCPASREGFETELYVYYGTNEYNFEELANPPAFEPTRCTRCATVIDLGEGGYAMTAAGYFCEACAEKEFGSVFGR